MNAEPLLSRHEPDPNEAARQRLLSSRGEPLFFADWLQPVFIHFKVEPDLLQPSVPFPLDLHNGAAIVSIVAFTMRGLRSRFGGAVGTWLLSPIATHELLNVRTHVTHHGERAIYFLSEWIPNPLSVLLGPMSYGLPYRMAKIEYHHNQQSGAFSGSVLARSGSFCYQASSDLNTHASACTPGSLEEFALEQYSACTCYRSRKMLFRVWHEPWLIQSINVRITQDSLLRSSFPWFVHASFISSHCSSGATNVWMGRPRRI